MAKKKEYTMPAVKLVAMPKRLSEDVKSLSNLLQSEEVSKLLKMFGRKRAVMKGLRSLASTCNEAMDLLLHELEQIKCHYPSQVVKFIKGHYEAK